MRQGFQPLPDWRFHVKLTPMLMNCPYRKLFLAISQIEHNFKLEVGDSQTAQLKMSVSVVSIAVSTNNYPFLMREQTGYCPWLEAGFVSHNDQVSFVYWSQSQPLTLDGAGLASDFVAVATLLV